MIELSVTSEEPKCLECGQLVEQEGVTCPRCGSGLTAVLIAPPYLAFYVDDREVMRVGDRKLTFPYPTVNISREKILNEAGETVGCVLQFHIRYTKEE